MKFMWKLNITNVTSMIGGKKVWFMCNSEWPDFWCLVQFLCIFWYVPERFSSVLDYIFGIWQVWQPILPKDGDFASPMLQRRKVRKLTSSIISHISYTCIPTLGLKTVRKLPLCFSSITPTYKSPGLQSKQYLIQHQQVFPLGWPQNQIPTSGTAKRDCVIAAIKKMNRAPQGASLLPPWTRRPWGCGCRQRHHQTWQTEGWQEWHFGPFQTRYCAVLWLAGRHLVAAAVPSVVSRTMPPTAPRLCTTRAFSTNMQSPLSTTTIFPTIASPFCRLPPQALTCWARTTLPLTLDTTSNNLGSS